MDLKERLVEAGINQTVLAKRLNINRGYLNAMLNGRYVNKSKNDLIKKIEEFVELVEKKFPIEKGIKKQKNVKKKIILKSKKS